MGCIQTDNPTFTLNERCGDLIGKIESALDSNRLHERLESPETRYDNRLRAVQATAAIENNSLSLKHVRNLMDGKVVPGCRREIQEIRNAFDSYSAIGTFDPAKVSDLLRAHGMMTGDILTNAGRFRDHGVGVYSGRELVHLAPPAYLVPGLIGDLLGWLDRSQDHPLVRGCVFHHEFEFVHPFSDGNGRTGRLWQTLILTRWRPEFEWIPVEAATLKHRWEYYDAIQASDESGDSGTFVEFMLDVILEAVEAESQA